MKIRKVVRHSYVSALFIVGLAISCFVLINVSDLVSNMLRDNQQLHGYTFEKYISGLYIGTIDSGSESAVTLEALSCAEEVTEGNVFVFSLFELNKSLDQYTVRVLIKQNEETGLSYTPLDETDKKNGAIMGESLKSHLLEDSEGYYVELGGTRIPIIGILDNTMAGGVDTSFYLFWENCDEDLRQKLVSLFNDHLEFYYASHENVQDSYTEFSNTLISKGFSGEEYEVTYSGDVENAWYEIYHSLFLPLCFVFSIFNCFIVSYVWLLYRKQEIAIRKAYGYHTGQLALLLGKEIAVLTLLGGILAAVMQLLYSYFFGVSMFDQQIWGKVGMIVIGMLGVIVVNVFFALLKIRQIQPSKVITEE